LSFVSTRRAKARLPLTKKKEISSQNELREGSGVSKQYTNPELTQQSGFFYIFFYDSFFVEEL